VGLTPAVELESVTASYDGNRALEEISLRIEPGTLAAILGPSGAGKTTLLKIIVGLQSPSQGKVRVLGLPPTNARKKVRYVPQLETINWNFPVTVEQVVGMGFLSNRRLPWLSKDQRNRISEILGRLGIADLQKRHILELSGGQQQRVFLARALIEDPDLLVLDEPTASTDVATRSDILGLLEDINKSGITVLLTTHDINLVANRVARIVLLNHTIVAHGEPRSVLISEALSATFGRPILTLEHDGQILVAEVPQEPQHRHHIHVHHEHPDRSQDDRILD
jgi:zinc/manganese transport system ATP-binding protein